MSTRPRRSERDRRDCLKHLLFAGWAASFAVHATAQAQTPLASTDETWHDPSRKRDLPLRLRFPAAPGPWPVVLYSHGLGGSREGGDAWGAAWQAAGLAVIHLQHPGSDAEVLRSSGFVGLRKAASAQQLLARVADVRFVLDEITRRHALPNSAWASARLNAIGLAGHSFGAQTVQAMAGQRFEEPAPLHDARLAGFIALSPNPGRNALSTTEQFGAVARPFLCVTGSLDGDPMGLGTHGARRATVFDGLPSAQRGLLWLEGADHMSFAGNALQRIRGSGAFQREPVAQEREPRHHAVIAQVTALWWRAQLGASAEIHSQAMNEMRQIVLPDKADRLQF